MVRFFKLLSKRAVKSHARFLVTSAFIVSQTFWIAASICCWFSAAPSFPRHYFSRIRLSTSSSMHAAMALSQLRSAMPG